MSPWGYKVEAGGIEYRVTGYLGTSRDENPAFFFGPMPFTTHTTRPFGHQVPMNFLQVGRRGPALQFDRTGDPLIRINLSWSTADQPGNTRAKNRANPGLRSAASPLTSSESPANMQHGSSHRANEHGFKSRTGIGTYLPGVITMEFAERLEGRARGCLFVTAFGPWAPRKSARGLRELSASTRWTGLVRPSNAQRARVRRAVWPRAINKRQDAYESKDADWKMPSSEKSSRRTADS
jgi:hypothetical protein